MRRRFVRKISNLKRLLNDYKTWRRSGGLVDKFFCIITDFNSSAGVMKGHYFHQDLLVASLIFADKPSRHIDIGSRIDGFVAHVASFRPIEVLDIRDLPSSVHENIIFTQADLTQNIDLGAVDSISCLHALEHFGLGRYGDLIDPEGHLKGLRNIVDALSCAGKLYISFPISNSPRVEFNAHRVFTPDWILGRPEVNDHLDLVRFDFVDDKGDLHINKQPSDAISSELKYGCGIYTFEKSKMPK